MVQPVQQETVFISTNFSRLGSLAELTLWCTKDTDSKTNNSFNMPSVFIVFLVSGLLQPLTRFLPTVLLTVKYLIKEGVG